MSEILLIDIGGTNIRYAYSDGNLESLTGTNKIKLSCIKGFDNILEDLTGQKEISSLVISVAGPKINGSITMTNRDFTINEAELKNKFQFESCHLLNDWESIGYSLSTFKESDVSIIKPGIEFNSNSFFIGPGTGLGAALLIGDKNVIPTEIGNTTGLTKALLRNYNIDNDDHFRTIEKFEILSEYFDEKNIEYKEIFSGNGNILTKIISLIYILDYVTIYKSILEGIDPTPVKTIEYIKNKMLEDAKVYADTIFLQKMTKKNFLTQLKQVDNGDTSARMHEVINQSISQIRDNIKFSQNQRTEDRKSTRLNSSHSSVSRMPSSA